MAAKPVLLAVTSDQHCCSTVGLCPPEGAKKRSGQRVLPSHVQRDFLWPAWEDFHRWLADLRRQHNAKLVYVINGDATDGGAHHGTTETMDGEPEVQSFITDRTFSVPRALKPAAMYMVTGTAVHVGGDSAPNELALARHLGCQRDPATDAWAVFHLRLDIHGRRFDFQHHGRSGLRPWTKQNVLSALACQIWMEHQLTGERHPDVAFRSHKHVFGDSYDAYPTRLVQLPAWQLKTAYAHRVVPESIASIGGVACLVQPDGAYDILPRLYKPALPTVRSVP